MSILLLDGRVQNRWYCDHLPFCLSCLLTFQNKQFFKILSETCFPQHKNLYQVLSSEIIVREELEIFDNYIFSSQTLAFYKKIFTQIPTIFYCLLSLNFSYFFITATTDTSVTYVTTDTIVNTFYTISICICICISVSPKLLRLHWLKENNF